ncbi:hypothetical protein QEN19_000524 [Hanseniaspora menglaensis]
MVLLSLNNQRLWQSKDNNSTKKNDLTALFFCSFVLAATLISLYSGFNRYMVRYEQAGDIPKLFFQNRNLHNNIGKNGKWLYGKVLSVGDGDNLNLYHMPGGIWGGWGVLRHEPKLKLNVVKEKKQKKLASTKQYFNPVSLALSFLTNNEKTSGSIKKKSLKTLQKQKSGSKSQHKSISWFNAAYNNWFTDKTTSEYFMKLPIYYFNNYKHKTISIRLCGIDAPERSHFGSKSQPFSDEAMNFLKHTLLNKKVYVKPLEIDRYGRCVARVVYYDGFFKQEKDISLELLKVGLATIYESKSAVDFDGQEDLYRKVENDSKMKKKGMWRLKKLESPAEFKKKLRC